MDILCARIASLLSSMVAITGKHGTMDIETGAVIITHPACGRVAFIEAETVLHIRSYTERCFIGPVDSLIDRVSMDCVAPNFVPERTSR